MTTIIPARTTIDSHVVDATRFIRILPRWRLVFSGAREGYAKPPVPSTTQRAEALDGAGAGAPVGNVPVRGTPIGPTGI